MRPLLLVAPLLAAAAAAQGPSCHGLSGLSAIAQQATAQLNLAGLTLRVDQHGQNVFQLVAGNHGPNQLMPLASASKTLSAAVLLSLCDQGRVRLDDPVSRWLPEYGQGALAAITLRMCFAHTTGLPALAAPASDVNLTMRQAAQQIAQLPLNFAPGTQFSYGEVSMQVAGAACEVAAGMPWAQLFQQQIGAPLGMVATGYYAYGATLNPSVADGGVSSAVEYGAFLEMLRQGGTFHSVRVLSAAAVDELLTDQMSWLPVRGTPHPNGVPCGLGCWIERQDAAGRTTLASMPGLFGFFGWLDRAHDSSGTWLANTFYVFSFPYVGQVWDEAALALAPLGVDCRGQSSPACASPPRLYATTWARALQGDFALRVDGAPAQAFGGVLVGLGPATAGVPVLDLWSYLPGSQYAFVLLPTDAAGKGSLPLPLPALPGATFTLQGCWIDPAGCGSSGLYCSRALQLDLLP